ncbi:MAG TPA: YfmQ family protein [Niallia sp.]|nr:YfmQ family protein [Niallia sp.]
MTLTVFLVTLFVCIIKILMTCLPTGVINWLTQKYKMHPTLIEEEVNITIDGKELETKHKKQVVDYFNQAIFSERYNIFPGNEELYLHPENNDKPIVIDWAKRNITLYVYQYEDRVDVVKQHNKKIIAYSLFPVPFQEVLESY